MTAEPELIVGWDAVAQFAGLTVEEAQRRADRGELPIHKIGCEIAATPTGLRQWQDRQPAPGETVTTTRTRRRSRQTFSSCALCLARGMDGCQRWANRGDWPTPRDSVGQCLSGASP